MVDRGLSWLILDDLFELGLSFFFLFNPSIILVLHLEETCYKEWVNEYQDIWVITLSQSLYHWHKCMDAYKKVLQKLQWYPIKRYQEFDWNHSLYVVWFLVTGGRMLMTRWQLEVIKNKESGNIVASLYLCGLSQLWEYWRLGDNRDRWATSLSRRVLSLQCRTLSLMWEYWWQVITYV